MTETESINAKNTRLIAAATILAALINKREHTYFGTLEANEIAKEAVRLFINLEIEFEDGFDD